MRESSNSWAARLARADGWPLVEVVQSQRGPVRRDAFGFADVLCLDPARGRVLLIQACNRGEVKDHLRRAGRREPREAIYAVTRTSGWGAEVWERGRRGAWRRWRSKIRPDKWGVTWEGVLSLGDGL